MALTYRAPAAPYANSDPLREMFEDNYTDLEIYKEAARRGLDPAQIAEAMTKRRALMQIAEEQKAKEAAAHEALYGKNAPGMVPAIDVAADMWLAKFGDTWVTESDLDNDYRVLLQRLCKFGAFELVGNFNSHSALYRLLPREMWATQK
jgi:hypothetical protein